MLSTRREEGHKTFHSSAKYPGTIRRISVSNVFLEGGEI